MGDTGVEAPGNGGVLRTIWTTAMDRYFIDLMLERVGRGYRVDGHLFSKRAWRHMTLLFNEKFHLQYSRDHLKNRQKTLRRIYRAVKSLLEQNGFTWDETQHMVTADDRVWINYTKAHPEARSYRTKSIPHFSDMCEIFQDASIGRYNDSTHRRIYSSDVQGTKIGGMVGGLQSSPLSVAPEDLNDYEQRLVSNLDRIVDEQELTMQSTSFLNPNHGIVDMLHEMATLDTDSANGKQDNTSENALDTLQTGTDALDACSGSRSRTYWQPPMDSYFIELMLEQVHQGNQFDGTFRKNAWIHMTELFNAKFGYKYDMVVLKNRYKTLKRQYTALRILLDQKGFVWDDARQMVTADDHICHDYIKVHPDAKQYITRPLPHFHDLSVIFKDVTIGEGYSDPAYNVDEQNEVLRIETGRPLGVQQSVVLTSAHGGPTTAVQASSSHLDGDIDILGRRNKRQFAAPLECQNFKRPQRTHNEDTMVELTHLGGDRIVSDKQSKHRTVSCQHSSILYGSSNEAMVNAIREMAAVVSSISDKSTESNNSTSTEDVIHALQATPDIDDDLILDACDLLEDDKKAKTFLSLDLKLRKKWLMRKLRT